MVVNARAKPGFCTTRFLRLQAPFVDVCITVTELRSAEFCSRTEHLRVSWPLRKARPVIIENTFTPHNHPVLVRCIPDARAGVRPLGWLVIGVLRRIITITWVSPEVRGAKHVISPR